MPPTDGVPNHDARLYPIDGGRAPSPAAAAAAPARPQVPARVRRSKSLQPLSLQTPSGRDHPAVVSGPLVCSTRLTLLCLWQVVDDALEELNDQARSSRSTNTHTQPCRTAGACTLNRGRLAVQIRLLEAELSIMQPSTREVSSASPRPSLASVTHLQPTFAAVASDPSNFALLAKRF